MLVEVRFPGAGFAVRPYRICRNGARQCRLGQLAALSEDAAPVPFTIPKGPQEAMAQAEASVLKGYQEGIKLQKLELLLPLIGATEIDDW